MWKSDLLLACKENYKYAREIRRFDLAKIWKICAKIASLQKNSNDEFEIPWPKHPMGRNLLTSMIDFCIQNGDFQTSATILSYFWPKKIKPNPIQKPKIAVSSTSNSTHSSPLHNSKSNYLTIHGGGPGSSSSSGEDIKNPDKKPKFWFMKPGALNTLANVASPYHTIQLGTQIPPG